MTVPRKATALGAVVAAMLAPAPAQGAHANRSAGAPGQQCKALKVKGKKTAEQRAAYKQCIQAAAKARGHRHRGDHHRR